jgi:hypothetical protein
MYDIYSDIKCNVTRLKCNIYPLMINEIVETCNKIYILVHINVYSTNIE